MTRLIDMIDLAAGGNAHEFQGHRYGAGVSFIAVDALPGGGPRLHIHPYEEVFLVQEGNATFTAGEEVIEVSAGQVVVVPAGVPHKFVNSARSTSTRATGSSPNGSKAEPVATTASAGAPARDRELAPVSSKGGFAGDPTGERSQRYAV